MAIANLCEQCRVANESLLDTLANKMHVMLLCVIAVTDTHSDIVASSSWSGR